MQSEATTVEQYLAELPPDRREAIRTVRRVVRENLPLGYEESMNWGMICYEVPLSICPDTYNGQPLMYAALASQERHMALYLMSVYVGKERRAAFEKAYRATGKRLDVGKSCVRFTKLDDLPLDLIARAVGAVSVDEYVRIAQAARARRPARRPPKKAARKGGRKARASKRPAAKRAARKKGRKTRTR
jgi:hypothetical protein